jgi:hypothetical protein
LEGNLKLWTEVVKNRNDEIVVEKARANKEMQVYLKIGIQKKEIVKFMQLHFMHIYADSFRKVTRPHGCGLSSSDVNPPS